MGDGRRALVTVGCVLALLPSTGCSGSAASSELLNLSGDGSLVGVQTTATFISRKAWVVRYSFDCTKREGTDGFGLDLHNSDDDSLSDQNENWRVTGRTGKGELRYEQAGEYYLDVVSPCRWNIRVKEQAG